MKSINDIIQNNTVSFEGLDESTVERIENLKDYYINECCCCGCDCKCCEPCEGTPASFIYFYTENEIVSKLKSDVKVQDIFNMHSQFDNKFRYVPSGKEMEIISQPLYFKETIYTQGCISEVPIMWTNTKFYNFIQKLVKQFNFTYPTVLSTCDGKIQLFFIMGGGTNGQECSIKSSLVKAVQVLNGLEAIKEINWAQVLDVSIDNLDDVYNFVITCTIEDKTIFDEKPKSIQDYIIKRDADTIELHK